MADIFISYSRKRRDVVERLAAALRAHGWAVWFDAHLTDDAGFRDEIARELMAARCALVLWCEFAIQSKFVRDEAGRADVRDALVQSRWQDVTPPIGFGETQAVDLIGWERGLGPKIAALIGALERKIGEPGKPTRGPMSDARPEPPKPAQTALPLGFARDVGPFGLDLLHPAVRAAAKAAREAEAKAEEIAIQAREAARKAEDAAARARRGEAGTKVEMRKVSDASDATCETEWANGACNGYGVRTVIAGPSAGQRYAGQ